MVNAEVRSFGNFPALGVAAEVLDRDLFVTGGPCRAWSPQAWLSLLDFSQKPRARIFETGRHFHGYGDFTGQDRHRPRVKVGLIDFFNDVAQFAVGPARQAVLGAVWIGLV